MMLQMMFEGEEHSCRRHDMVVLKKCVLLSMQMRLLGWGEIRILSLQSSIFSFLPLSDISSPDILWHFPISYNWYSSCGIKSRAKRNINCKFLSLTLTLSLGCHRFFFFRLNPFGLYSQCMLSLPSISRRICNIMRERA